MENNNNNCFINWNLDLVTLIGKLIKMCVSLNLHIDTHTHTHTHTCNIPDKVWFFTTYLSTVCEHLSLTSSTAIKVLWQNINTAQLLLSLLLLLLLEAVALILTAVIVVLVTIVIIIMVIVTEYYKLIIVVNVSVIC